MLLLNQKKGKGAGGWSRGLGYKNMYELIINGRTVYTTTNKEDANMKEMFNFYATNKAIMNITEMIIINANEEFFFEG